MILSVNLEFRLRSTGFGVKPALSHATLGRLSFDRKYIRRQSILLEIKAFAKTF
jgi:hypothetical protein